MKLIKKFTYILLIATVLFSQFGGMVGQADAAVRSDCEKLFKGNATYIKRCRTTPYYGHRAVHEYPENSTNENTMLALKEAQRLGAGCETDTWPLKSDSGQRAQGQAVIFHDNTLGRVVSPESLAAAGIASPKISMVDVTFAQFQKLRTKGGEPLPTLKEWVTYAAENKIRCRIEIKWGPTTAELHELADIIRQNNATRHVSFYGSPQSDRDCSIASLLRILNDPAMDGIVVGVKQPASKCVIPISVLVKHGFSYVTVGQKVLKPVKDGRALVAKYHRHGIQVGNHSSGDPLDWKRDIAVDLDFIIARDPAALKKWLRG